MRKQIKIKKIVGYLLITLMAFGFVGSLVPANAYICKEGDTECEEAKANMEAKQNEANAFTRKATSVAEIIEQLNADIASINEAIAEIEAEIKVLNIEIKQTEKKLKETQTALAEMLVNIHFSDDSEPIRVLAGSRSISDYAEKAAREEVAKQEVAMMSEKIKVAKEKLDQKKSEVEAKLKENEQAKLALADKKESQKSLMAIYEKNANDASAVAAYWEKQVQQMAWIPPSNTVGFGSRWWGSPANTYPYSGVCGPGYIYSSTWYINGPFPYGGLICQCTDYANWKAYEKFGIMAAGGGNAWQYAYTGGGKYVPKNGKTTYVNSNPAPNTIVIWPQTCGPNGCDVGHVAWVESVNSDGSLNITEYNVTYPSWDCYEKAFCSRTGVGSSGLKFLHFE